MDKTTQSQQDGPDHDPAKAEKLADEIARLATDLINCTWPDAYRRRAKKIRLMASEIRSMATKEKGGNGKITTARRSNFRLGEW